MSIASLGPTTNSALTQAQAILQGHHGRKAVQAAGTDLLSQISAQLTARPAGSSGTPPTAGAPGFAASLGQLGTDVLSILGIGGGGTSTPATAASAYATSQSSI